MEKVKIDTMQFGFMPGKGTTDAIFKVRQMQEKLESALCGDANPRRLQRQSCCG